ncbi:TPA: hypothetical protein ACXORD_005264 [Bacillus luti]
MGWIKDKGNGGAAHTHPNKATLDKFSESNGAPLFEGKPIASSQVIHEHPNKATLDKFSEANNGDPLYNGKPIVSAQEMHTHKNLEVLEKFGDKLGNPTFNGEEFKPHDHANKPVIDKLGYDGTSLLYEGKPLNTTNLQVIEKPSENIIFDFDIQNISVSEKQILLSIPVEKYNANSKAVVHPSVLFFEERWNGYSYWMGINPYAGINFENPAIFCSNDGVNWIEPPGIKNPIDGMPSKGYYSDIHLFMDKDGKTMHCLNRHYDDTFRAIYVYSSTDGVNWIDKHTALESTDAKFDFLSPAVLLDKGRYTMFAVDMVKQLNNGVRDEIDVYTTHDIRGTWGKSGVIKVPNLKPDERVWHLEVRRISGIYYLLYQTCDIVASGTNGRLYLMKSSDLNVWETIEMPISSMFNSFGKTVYKSSFLPFVDGKGLNFKVWYCITGGAGNWDLGYVELYNNKPKVNDIGLTPSKGKILFHDNFMRQSGDSLSSATKGTWVVGANPCVGISNGIASSLNGKGADSVYTIINCMDYIVDLKLDEIPFDKRNQGFTFYVAAPFNTDFQGMFLGYDKGKLSINIRKDSNTIRSFYIRTSLKRDDIISFYVNNSGKVIKVLLNGYIIYTYRNEDNIMVTSNTRIGFKGQGSPETNFALKQVVAYGINHKDAFELIVDASMKLFSGSTEKYKGDNFKKANGAVGNLLEDITPWVQSVGSFVIEKNKLKAVSGTESLLSCDAGWRDFEIAINTANRGGIILRYVDNQNYIYIDYENFDKFTLNKMVNGEKTVVKSITLTSSIAPNSKVVAARVKGTNFQCFVNGVLYIDESIVDAVFSTTTKCGVYTKYTDPIGVFLISKN